LRDQLIEAAAAARADAVEGKPFAELDAGTQEKHRHAALVELRLYFGVFKEIGLSLVPRTLPDNVAFAVSDTIVVQAEGQQMKLATGTVQDYWQACVAELDKE